MRVILIGAGPAGLTAAAELLRQGVHAPLVLEAGRAVGGLSRTVRYRGHRMDLGGHRFFTRSERVLRFWFDRLPLQRSEGVGLERQHARWAALSPSPRPDPRCTDSVMLLRSRKSRIVFEGQFYDYPLRLGPGVARQLGARRSLRIARTYLRARLDRSEPENLEQFFVSRFGDELYRTFFRAYTEKVWGLPCSQLSADWGAQRVKGLSLARALRDALLRRAGGGGLDETSLIDAFLYPKLGPGQLWEHVAEEVRGAGGEVLCEHRVVELLHQRGRIIGVVAEQHGARKRFLADVVLSSMPLRALIGLLPDVPAEVRQVAAGLRSRDFLTVGLLLRRLRRPLDDTWLYVHDPAYRVGRIQLFHNWSPWLVDGDYAWVGLEYFCSSGDGLWRKTDRELTELARSELQALGIADASEVVGSKVVRVPYAYPTYSEGYGQLPKLRRYLDGIPGLGVLGRNGMHRYDNQDHAMLTAMQVVDNLVSGQDVHDPWAVNTEKTYLERDQRA